MQPVLLQRLFLLSCPLPGKQNHESLKDQLCVKHEAPVINILEIKADHFIEISDVRAAADLHKPVRPGHILILLL